jgi:hypothetical protein
VVDKQDARPVALWVCDHIQPPEPPVGPIFKTGDAHAELQLCVVCAANLEQELMAFREQHTK